MEKQEYFSDKPTQVQRGSNPRRMHDWRGMRQALYLNTTSPSFFVGGNFSNSAYDFSNKRHQLMKTHKPV